MELIETVTDTLRADGHYVNARRWGTGAAGSVTGVEVKRTGTGASFDGPLDLSNTVLPAGGVAYIQRTGLVWLVSEGPTEGTIADVWVAGTAKGKLTDEQKAVVDRVVAVLAETYGVSESKPTSAEDNPSSA